MSSRYVRNLFRGWMLSLPVAFYDTENKVVRPVEPTWATLEFGIPAGRAYDYCGHQGETGEINLVFLGRQGVGDDEMLSLADQCMDIFMAKVDPNNAMTLTNKGAPMVYSDSRNYFCVAVPVEYDYHPT